MFLTADHVAAAIVAGAQEVAPHEVERIALAVASGEQTRGGPNGKVEIGRARGYAAMALRREFKTSGSAISRMVGAGSPAVYLTTLSNEVTKGNKAWWDDAAFERVAEAVRAVKGSPETLGSVSRDPAPKLQAQPERAPQPRVFASPGKNKLMNMLKEAVLNTAKLPSPD